MGMIGNSLAQGLISGANIQDGTVDTPDLKDGAVTTAKIADGGITSGKLASGVALSNLGYTPLNKAGDLLGGGSYTKVSTSTTGGNLSFDNGTTDTPGLHFYYGNSKNFGVDVSSSKLRVVKNLDETGGAELFTIDESGHINTVGNIIAAGSIFSQTNLRSGAASDSAANIGADLYCGSDANSYSRIRIFEGSSASNTQTIHFFSTNWGGAGASFEGGSKGAININGNNGVTFGGWNSPDASINSTRMRINGDRYTLYGPNSSWGKYLAVGGNGNHVTNDTCSVAATDGNLHIDCASGGHGTYINWYAAGPTNIGNGSGGYGTLNYGTLNQASDYRLKSDIQPMADGATALFMQIQFKEYLLNGCGDARKRGVIAHDLQLIFADAVNGAKDAVKEDGAPDYQSVDYFQICMVMGKTVQEQQLVIEQMQTRLAALEA